MEPEQMDVEYKLTEKELQELIRKTLVEDCKIDACLDKFLFDMYSLGRSNRRWDMPWIDPETNRLVDTEECVSLRNGLLADLKAHVPKQSQEWFDGLESPDEQFMAIRSRLEKRAEEFSIKDIDSFQASIYRVLGETKTYDALHLEPPDASSGSGAASLQATVNKHVLSELASAVEGEVNSSFFTCGGTIAVAEPQIRPNDQEPKEPTYILSESTPISLFWLLNKEKGPQKVTLPPKDGDPSTLEDLAKDCVPATFGRGQEDVLDPTYRLAGKLDPSSFSTTFHPADFGILDSVEQILLPNSSTSTGNSLNFRRVRAELYKLNIYSGPSGIFRAHVDTPRSTNQFGSLVVCLPSQHQGGALVVKHNGKATAFNWAENSASTIQWGAFYSDCEHEIKTVTEGHRITLTYNLYVTEPAEAGFLPVSILQPSVFPLYGQLKDMLEERGFFTRGGVLGFHCAHYYPHTNQEADFNLPRNLKGSDMALFSIFKSLGLEVKILPVLDCDDSDWDESYHETELENYRRDGYMSERYRENGPPLPFSLHYDNSFPTSHGCEDIDKRWRILLSARHPKGTDLSEDQTFIGTGFHSLTITSMGEGERDEDIARANWQHTKVSGITWLTEPRYSEEALIHLCYGNQASIGTQYSSVAIFAVVPPWAQRVSSFN